MASNIKSARGSWVRSDVQLDGKTVIVTGSNTGIGLETTKDLVKRGAKVFMACRNTEKAQEARNQVLEETKCDEDKVVVKKLDLSSFESIREFAADINQNESKLDILVNNAGVMACPQGKTKDGFETQFGVNHLGTFLLTNLLLDLIKKSTPSRIVTVSSQAHKFNNAHVAWDDFNGDKNFNTSFQYSQSKLMNILFSRELSKRLEGTGVTTYALHPGVVRTELWRHAFNGEESISKKILSVLAAPITRLFFKTPVHGAQTSIFCAIAPEQSSVSGKYYSDCAVYSESSNAKNDEDAKRLWEVSEELTGLVAEEQQTQGQQAQA